MKLIDKDAIVSEIESYINNTKFSQKAGMIKKRNAEMKITIFKSILSFINTLEMKEVDLRKEIDTYFDNYEIASKEDCYLTYGQACAFAEHFFELGIKTQKGE